MVGASVMPRKQQGWRAFSAMTTTSALLVFMEKEKHGRLVEDHLAQHLATQAYPNMAAFDGITEHMAAHGRPVVPASTRLPECIGHGMASLAKAHHVRRA